ncbi:MAG: flagellar hook-associated protein FlgL [Gammaproteobacteria bacterium]|nr:flagellar hook-associated protein FlgL [Gammaproteobacteria bacterium]
MRISTLEIQRQAVAAINDRQVELATTQSRLASGRRVLTPADDPAAAERILTLKEQLNGNAQFARNANRATNRLQLEETVLANVTDILQGIRDRAVQGANASLSAADRRFVAADVEQSLDALLALSNTRDANGEYIFAGNRTLTEPFARGPGNAVTYNGDQDQRELLIGPGRRMPVGDDGVEVFQRIPNGNGTFRITDAPGNTGSGVAGGGSVVDPGAFDAADYTIDFTASDVFQVVNDATEVVVAGGTFQPGDTIAFQGIQVRIQGRPAAGDAFAVTASTSQDLFTTVQNTIDALRGNVATANPDGGFNNAIGRSLADLDQALENILDIRAQVGARLATIEDEDNIRQDVNLFTETTLSELEDLDFAKAASDFNLQLTALQAAQQAFTRIQGLSLFNFL